MAKQTFTTGQVLTAAQMTSLQQTAMGGGSASVKTTSYVLVAADAGTVIQMNAAVATTITVNTSLFSAGDSVQIQNIGAGTCTITAGTATVNSAGSLAVTQYDGGFLYFSSASSAIWFDYTQPGTTSPLTTKGDLYTRTSTADARLAVGANGTTLVADSSEATGLKWQAASGGGSSFTKLSTGTISGTSYQVTGLSGYNKIAISFQNCRNTTAYMSLSLNNNTTAVYETVGFTANTTSGTAGYDANYASIGGSQFNLVGQAGSTNNLTGWVFLDGCNTAGPKIGYQIMGITPQNTNLAINGGMVWPGTAVVSSIEFFSPNGGTNSNGKIEVYGSVN